MPAHEALIAQVLRSLLMFLRYQNNLCKADLCICQCNIHNRLRLKSEPVVLTIRSNRSISGNRIHELKCVVLYLILVDLRASCEAAKAWLRSNNLSDIGTLPEALLTGQGESCQQKCTACARVRLRSRRSSVVGTHAVLHSCICTNRTRRLNLAFWHKQFICKSLRCNPVFMHVYSLTLKLCILLCSGFSRRTTWWRHQHV